MATKVVLIEDEPAIAANVRYALSTEGFAPVWCRTGAEGLAELEKGDVSLVLLDVGLPDANGFDLARQVRARFEVPIIFVTCRADEIDRVVGLEIGADDYVVKPFSPRELTARVRAVLRRTQRSGQPPAADAPAPTTGGRPPAPPCAVCAGPFLLDELKIRIHFSGRELDLARIEYRLLSILIRHPGQVFTRDRLMELAWDGPTSSGDRTVDTHMKTLRRKLHEIAPGEDWIVTHRGVGYSLKEPA